MWFEIKADLDTALGDLDESVRLPLVQSGQCGFALQVQPDLLMAAVKIRQLRQHELLYD